jgi:hypothetical protein
MAGILCGQEVPVCVIVLSFLHANFTPKGPKGGVPICAGARSRAFFESCAKRWNTAKSKEKDSRKDRGFAVCSTCVSQSCQRYWAS